MCAGMFCDFATFEVSGSTVTSPAGPWLKASTLRTSTGRRPCCSCPAPVPKSANQTSPRAGSAMSLRPFARRDGPSVLGPTLVRVQAVHEGRVPHIPFGRFLRPGGRIRPQGSVAGVQRLEEDFAAVLGDSQIENVRYGLARPLGQLVQRF